MGIYLNPGNSGFSEIRRGKYVDKTGLIACVNERIGTPDKFICISRPRRFGKSFAAEMLCAYYDHTCCSHDLFEDLEISRHPLYQQHLNQYNVLVLDIAGILSRVKRTEKTVRNLVDYISDSVKKDLIAEYPEWSDISDVSECLEKYVGTTGRKFIFILDEWDAVIREARHDEAVQREYLNLLREWFKNRNFTPRIVAASYMTGILPIKKDGSQSAISDFREYSVLDPGIFTEYTGFTEKEVRSLCDENQVDFDQMRFWYDGYSFEKSGSIYNPYSVMETIKSGEFESHWQKTSVAENLVTYINMDQDGLQSDILKLLSGEPLKVNVRGFSNDFENFRSKDDVLTLLIHLGYLSYDKNTGRVRIPNEEVRLEFTDILDHPKHTKLASLVAASEKLLKDTLAGNEAAVASALEKVRETNYAPQYYNHEQALRYAVKFAYIICIDRFLKIEELPSGKGLADLVLIPNRDTAYPAIIIELKWNKAAEDALSQIDEKRYDSVLKGYTGDILKVGITYDANSKIHSCKIETL